MGLAPSNSSWTLFISLLEEDLFFPLGIKGQRSRQNFFVSFFLLCQPKPSSRCVLRDQCLSSSPLSRVRRLPRRAARPSSGAVSCDPCSLQFGGAGFGESRWSSTFTASVELRGKSLRIKDSKCIRTDPKRTAIEKVPQRSMALFFLFSISFLCWGMSVFPLPCFYFSKTKEKKKEKEKKRNALS